jgi:hypothetical protein
MDWSPSGGRDSPQWLARMAEQLEQLTPYLSRADSRNHGLYDATKSAAAGHFENGRATPVEHHE